MGKRNSGFTLIELVVVMAIIAVLVSMSLYNFSLARAKARDISRKNDLKQIATAMEAYRAEKQQYPDSANLSDLVTGGYISQIFIDPKIKLVAGSWVGYSYTRGADALSYALVACLENAGDPDKVTPTVNCAAPATSGVKYQVTEK